MIARTSEWPFIESAIIDMKDRLIARINQAAAQGLQELATASNETSTSIRDTAALWVAAGYCYKANEILVRAHGELINIARGLTPRQQRDRRIVEEAIASIAKAMAEVSRTHYTAQHGAF